MPPVLVADCNRDSSIDQILFRTFGWDHADAHHKVFSCPFASPVLPVVIAEGKIPSDIRGEMLDILCSSLFLRLEFVSLTVRLFA